MGSLLNSYEVMQIQRWWCQKSTKSEYLYNYFGYYCRHSPKARKYHLTSNLRLFQSVVNIKYINKCKVVFDFKRMGFLMICQGMWGLRDRAI